MNNKEIGDEFEENLTLILAHKGYWVSLFPKKNHSNSQPADMVAIKDDIGMLIEAKDLTNKNGKFPLSRLEENQIRAFKRFIKCGNSWYNLAVLWNDTVYIIPLCDVDFSKKSIDIKEKIPFLRNYTKLMEEINNEKQKQNGKI